MKYLNKYLAALIGLLLFIYPKQIDAHCLYVSVLDTIPPANIQANKTYTLTLPNAINETEEEEDTNIGAVPLPISFSPEDYSGITWLCDNKYAVVSDTKDGFYILSLPIHATGNIEGTMLQSPFYGDAAPVSRRDCEGIVYHAGQNTLFIAGEADQEVLEYTLAGDKTGRKLAIPSIFKSIVPGYGFEALAYNQHTGTFWTTTESTLPIDGECAGIGRTDRYNRLRIQSFDELLQASAQYAYKMDLPQVGNKAAYYKYAFGVAEITALADGQLLVLEREFFVAPKAIFAMGSWVHTKIYIVSPSLSSDVSGILSLSTLDDSQFMHKKLLWERCTDIFQGIANYEGMCLGPTLSDGSIAVLLINDSQARYNGILDEYILPLKLTLKD